MAYLTYKKLGSPADIIRTRMRMAMIDENKLRPHPDRTNVK